MARRQGATEQQLAAMEGGEYDIFEEPWRAAFAYADMVTPTPGIVGEAVYQRLAASWTPRQIVEITAVIAMYNFFNRFAHALDIPVTR